MANQRERSRSPLQSLSVTNIHCVVKEVHWKTLEELRGPRFFGSDHLAATFAATATSRMHENPALAAIGTRQFLHIHTFERFIEQKEQNVQNAAVLAPPDLQLEVGVAVEEF